MVMAPTCSTCGALLVRLKGENNQAFLVCISCGKQSADDASSFKPSAPSARNLRELQNSLPWTIRYHRDFRSNPQAHKDFEHALLHVFKAAGKLAAICNDAEHGGHDFNHNEVAPYVADLVVCALRMANTCPNQVIDLQAAVEDRIATKNQLKQDAKARHEPPDVIASRARATGREVTATPPFESEQDRDERIARQRLREKLRDDDRFDNGK
jgi:hypothetical protein